MTGYRQIPGLCVCTFSRENSKCLASIQCSSLLSADAVHAGAQILAGEEIENQFGARLGLSTLAAAGLGNLLSDICGLGLADQIEARTPLGLVREF